MFRRKLEIPILVRNAYIFPDRRIDWQPIFNVGKIATRGNEGEDLVESTLNITKDRGTLVKTICKEKNTNDFQSIIKDIRLTVVETNVVSREN